MKPVSYHSAYTRQDDSFAKLSCKANVKSGKKTRQTEEEAGRQHQGMDRPGVHRVPESSGEQRKMEETGREVVCGAPTIPEVKG